MCRARGAVPTSRRSRTACARSASRASRSTLHTASSRPRVDRSSSPTPPVTSDTHATCSPAHPRRTRRHALISSLLGIEHMVVCVNKMDLVDWDASRFEEVRDQVPDLVRRLGVPDLQVVPISALHGDNVVSRSSRSPFYDGPALLEYLEELDVQADRDLWRLRVPVPWVGRPNEGGPRVYAGSMVAGTVRAGDEGV